MREFVCSVCGIEVHRFSRRAPGLGEKCAHCLFLETIEDADDREMIRQFIARNDVRGDVSEEGAVAVGEMGGPSYDDYAMKNHPPGANQGEEGFGA